MDMFEGKKNKGRVFSVYTKFIKKKWGNNGVEACRKAMGLETMNFEEERWYPHKYGADMAAWIADNHGMDECRQLGYTIATERGVVSYFAWMAGLNKVLDRFVAEIRDSANYGEIRIERGENSATAYFQDVCATEAGCQLWLGVFEGLLKLTKTKGSAEKLECQHKGNDNCVYKMTWN